MHAWDCPCGTRNAPTFSACRNCRRPAAQGRPVGGVPAPRSSRLSLGCLAGLHLAAALSLLFGQSSMRWAIRERRLAREYPVPVVLSYADLVRRHPREGWFRVTGGAVNLAEAGYKTLQFKHHERVMGQTVIRVFAPVPPVDAPDQKAAIVLNATDPALCGTVDTLRKLDEPGREAERKEWLEKHEERWWRPGEIEGTV